MRSATARSISPWLIVSIGSTLRTTTGFDLIDSGESHSCVMPTSESLSPRAQTISVAEGRKETILGIGVRIKSYDDRNSAIGVINHELCSCKHFRADQCVVAFAQNHLDRSLFAKPFDLTQRHGGRHLCATNQLKDKSRDDWKIQAFNVRVGKYESAIETCVEHAL